MLPSLPTYPPTHLPTDLLRLHEAAFQGQAEAARHLLAAGANPDAAGKGGTCALHLAARHGHLDVARALCDAGASPLIADGKGLSPLHLAVRYGRVAIARLLLDAGATTDAVDRNGATPLHSAVGAVGSQWMTEAAEAAEQSVSK